MEMPERDNKVNWNTALLILGVLATGVGWGVNWSELREGRRANAANIERLEREIRPLADAVRNIDRHEVRITLIERKIDETSSAIRSLEGNINLLTSDTRLMRDALERIDNRQNGPRSRSPP